MRKPVELKRRRTSSFDRVLYRMTLLPHPPKGRPQAWTEMGGQGLLVVRSAAAAKVPPLPAAGPPQPRTAGSTQLPYEGASSLSTWPRVMGPVASLTTARVAASAPLLASSSSSSCTWRCRAISSSVSGGGVAYMARSFPQALHGGRLPPLLGLFAQGHRGPGEPNLLRRQRRRRPRLVDCRGYLPLRLRLLLHLLLLLLLLLLPLLSASHFLSSSSTVGSPPPSISSRISFGTRPSFLPSGRVSPGRRGARSGRRPRAPAPPGNSGPLGPRSLRRATPLPPSCTA